MMKRIKERSETLENIGTTFGRKPNLKRSDEQVAIANYEQWYKKGYSPSRREYIGYPGSTVFTRR